MKTECLQEFKNCAKNVSQYIWGLTEAKWLWVLVGWKNTHPHTHLNTHRQAHSHTHGTHTYIWNTYPHDTHIHTHKTNETLQLTQKYT